MSKTTTLTLVDGVRVVVPDTLDQITPYVLREQEDWFEDEIRFLRRLLQPGEQIIDIGANHGVYTLSMAKTVGPNGRVWAFEPASTTSQLLAASIEANEFRHVVLDRSALSDHSGTAELSLNVNSELNALAGPGTPAGHSEKVALTTLDECFVRFAWRQIDFLKIDAEGEEARILQGGARFFAELSPLVQYEIKAGRDFHVELVHLFTALGYDSYRLVPGLDLLVPFHPEEPPDGYLLNLFACKRDRAESLAARGHLLDAATKQVKVADSPVNSLSRNERRDAYGWRNILRGLPYADGLSSTWEQTIASGQSAEVSEALRHYAVSRDATRPMAERFYAIQSSLDLFIAAVERSPAFLRLASLARVAQDFGARTRAVNALQQLCNQIVQARQVDPREPFLLPTSRFDEVPPGEQIGNWVLASALEQLERLGSFSSFYSAEASQPRLESIASLGFASAEMIRRRQLVQARRGAVASPTVPAPPSTNVPAKGWSLLDLFPQNLQFDVLDVGATLNQQPAYQALVEAKRVRITGIEPNAAECERLNREYDAPHRFFPHFVGDGQPATFHATNSPLTGSLFAPNTPMLEKFQNLAEVITPVATHLVDTKRIDDLAEIDNIDLFEIDVQGGELAAFRGASKVLTQALVVQTGVGFVELYQGQPLFADVDKFLRSQGFQFHAFNRVVGRAFKPLVVNNDSNAPVRQTLWANAVYVRDWMRLEQLEPIKLLKYAVLAHDVLASFDLAHLVLQALDHKSGGSFAAQYLARLTGASHIA